MPRRQRLSALLLCLCLLAPPAVAEPLRVAVAANFRATAERAGAAQAAQAPIARHPRVDGLREAARDAVWSSWRSFFDPQGPRSRRSRG